MLAPKKFKFEDEQEALADTTQQEPRFRFEGEQTGDGAATGLQLAPPEPTFKFEGETEPQIDLGKYPKFRDVLEKLPGVGSFIQGEDLVSKIAPAAVSQAYNAFSRGFLGLAAKGLQLGGVSLPGDVSESKLYQTGKVVEDALEEIFPDRPEYRDSMLLNALPRTLGEVSGLAGGALVAGTLGAPGLVTGAGTALFGGGIASTDEFNQALEQTDDQDLATDVFLRTLPVNVGLEAIPWGRWLKRLGRLGGKAGQEAVNEAIKKYGGAILEGSIGAVEEASTEIAQQIYTNWNAQETYDNTRKLFEGVGESGFIGGLVGFALNAMGVSVRNKLAGAKTKVEEATLREAERVIEDAKVVGEEAQAQAEPQPKGAPLDAEADPTAIVKKESYQLVKDEPLPDGEASEIRDEGSPAIPLSPFKEGWKKSKDWFLFWFRPRGNKPLEVYEALKGPLGKEFRYARDLKEAAQAVVQLRQVTREVYGSKGPTKAQKKAMTAYMTYGKKSQKYASRRGPLPRNRQLEGEMDLAVRESVNDPDPSPEVFGKRPEEWSRDALDPEIDFGLPQNIRSALDRLRAVQDRISMNGIEDKLVEGKLAAAIEDGEGSYMYRSYAIHDDPKYYESVPREIKNQAKAAIREGLVAMREWRIRKAYRRAKAKFEEQKGREMTLDERNSLRDFIDRREPAITDEVIAKEIETILFEGSQTSNPYELFKGRKLGNIDLSVFKKRKDIPPEIRALLGEYDDPIVVFSKSVIRSAAFFQNLRFLNEVAANGRGKFFWSFNDPDRPEAAKAVLFPNDDPAINPLAGMRTFPEVRKEFEHRMFDTGGIAGKVLSSYLTANAFVKGGKTLGNFPMGYFRNLIGGSMVALANGHRPGRFGLREAFEITMQDMTDMTQIVKQEGPIRKAVPNVVKSLEENFGLTEEAQNRVLRLTELGVLVGNINVHEVRDFIKDAKWDDTWLFADFDPFTGSEGYKQAFQKYVARPTKKTIRGAGKLWNGGDNFVRLMFFHAEKARHKRALYGERELTPQENDRLEEMVAKKLVMTYFDHGRIPRITKLIRTIPWIGGYVSFISETFRILPNSVRIGLNEIKDSNPEMRKIGWARLSGALVTMALPEIIGYASMQLAGVTEEEDEYNQRFMADWDRNSARIYFGRDLFVNTGYTDPYGHMKAPIWAMLHQDDDVAFRQKLIESMRGLFGSFYEPEILAGRIGHIFDNQKPTGGPIFNEQDVIGEQAKDIYEYMWEGVAPGTILAAAKMRKAITGEKTKSGRKYELSDEIAAMFGFRPVRLDKPRSLKFIAIDYRAADNEAAGILRGTEKAGDTTKEELKDAVRRANERRLELFKEMQINIRAAGRSGVSYLEIEQALLDGGLSKPEIDRLFSNAFRPTEIKEETLFRKFNK